MGKLGNKSVVRRYEVLQSKNRFYCGGRCMSSRQVGIFIFALILLIGTSGLFFIFDCPYLSRTISIAIPLLGAVQFIFILVVFFRTACTDPGILPRSERDEILYNEKQALKSIGDSNSSQPTQMINNTQMPRFKEVKVKGKTVKLKYCFTCKLYRPPRSSHCSVCDNCVEKFDHHCPWVGNCVGKRNYRFFYLFLVGLSFYTLFILSCNVAHLVMLSQKSTFVEAIKKAPATVVQLVICFFSMWSIFCLCGYHTYLISSEISTNEDIKESFSNKRNNSNNTNPYDHGSILTNFGHVLCSSIPPSVMNLRETIPAKQIPSNSNNSRQVYVNNDTNDQSINGEIPLRYANPQAPKKPSNSNLYNSNKMSVQYSSRITNGNSSQLNSNFDDINSIRQ